MKKNLENNLIFGLQIICAESFYLLFSIFKIKLFTGVFTGQLCTSGIFYAPLSKRNVAKINKNSLWVLVIVRVRISQFIIHLIVVLMLAVIITTMDLLYASVSGCVWLYAHTVTKSVS